MAQTGARSEPEPGAPIARDEIDPDLVKLARTRLQIGMLTCLGLVILCVYFILRLAPDRHFGSESENPTPVKLAALLANKVEPEGHVSLDVTPMVSSTLRVGKSRADVGLRVVPVRGGAERVWLAVDSDTSGKPTGGHYAGRLRRLEDLPFANALHEQARSHPRPIFAPPAAVRAAFATGKLTSVDGTALTMAPGDKVSVEIVVPDAALVIASLSDRFKTPAAWEGVLAAARIPVKLATPHPTDAKLRQVRFETQLSVGKTLEALSAQDLYARVEPIHRHHDTTWGELAKSGPGGLAFGKDTVPDAIVELVGLYAPRTIPDGAYVLLADERPEDYWYVMPITIALGVIALLFAWAFVRAVRRDLLPARA